MFKIGNHEFRDFTALDSAFGADHKDYPDIKSLPEEYRKGRAPGCKIFSSLFFKGGSLEDHNVRLKDPQTAPAFYVTLRALMGSFAPPHEVKTATCGLLIDTYTETINQ